MASLSCIPGAGLGANGAANLPPIGAFKLAGAGSARALASS